MSLFEKLRNASSEEDVKDAYIKALGLKAYQKNLIDIQTKEIWFEAKVGYKVSTYAMFTQLLHYVQVALNEGEEIPPFLCVIDSVKAALMKTEIALPLLKKRTIKWGKSASAFPQEALDAVSQYIGTHFITFRIETQEKEFVETVRSAIRSGEIVRTQITPDNLKQVFDRWVEMIGREISGVPAEDYCLLFFADIMSDGTVATHENLPAELLHKNGKPTFLLNGKLYQLGNYDGYRKFWAIYARPPEPEYRNYLLERRDSLIPYDERSFKGAYYTLLHVVDKSYDLLAKTLGKNWQRDYIVWDPCCGVGNLETKHGNARNIFMSTLDQADVDVMRAAKTCRAATRFQYDFLNDDITEDGEIDYALSGKLPQSLRDAIAEANAGKKKFLILMNPPYAEATNADNASKGIGLAKNKSGVAKTKAASAMMGSDYGKATNELFTQFVVRVSKEIPNATIAMFSTLKYVNSTNFEKFRERWNAEFLDGFVVHSKAFDGIKGNFPIGFLIWQQRGSDTPAASLKSPLTETSQSGGNAASLLFPSEISCEVLDKSGNAIGEKKFYNLPAETFLSKWIKRPRANDVPVVPLTNAVEVTRGNPRVDTWSEEALAYMCAGTNDLQNANYVYLLSSAASRGNGFYVTPENLGKAAIVFSVQRLIKPTWLNDRDQFLQPDKPFPQEFADDCFVWMLFSGSNLTAGADGLEWNGKTWSLVNHFVPFTEDEVNASGRFESDFTVRLLAEKTLSSEAHAVLDAGRELWRAYFERSMEFSIREKLKLNRPDVGWYQIRNALKLYNETGDAVPVSFSQFESAYKALSEKLRPKVFEYGFLK